MLEKEDDFETNKSSKTFVALLKSPAWDLKSHGTPSS